MTNIVHQNDLPSDVIFKHSVAIDTEAMGLNNHRDRLCLVQISAGDGHAHLVQFDKGNYNAPNLKKLLTDQNILKIFHYARFDMAVMKRYLGVDVENVYCTKIVSKLVRTYTDSHSLKNLCEELLDKKLSKQCQSSDWGSAKLSKEQIQYAASDVLYLHDLKDALDKMLAREGREDLAISCFNFLKTRIALDLGGWIDHDIFSHGGTGSKS